MPPIAQEVKGTPNARGISLRSSLAVCGSTVWASSPKYAPKASATRRVGSSSLTTGGKEAVRSNSGSRGARDASHSAPTIRSIASRT